MPWTAKDTSRHKKGLNPQQRKAWASIANNVLSRTGSDASAIKIANARAGQTKRKKK